MMKLRQYHFSWLVAMAAGVAMTAMTACSSENELTETPIVEQPAQPTAKGVKVTVTAGISDGAQTRSTVTEGTDAQGKTTRTLKFTGPKGNEGDPDYEPGDRLYIHGIIFDNHPSSPGYDPTKDEVVTALYGYLDIDPTSIGADGTTASFSGTLHTEDLNTDAKDAYDFQGGDPLAACNYDENDGYGEPAHAYLVHSGTKAGSYTINSSLDFRYNSENMFADDVETLMTTALYVVGRYDKNTKGFTLSGTDAILNCTLSGLAADHDYTATLATNSFGSNYDKIAYNIHTGVDGACAFAISTYTNTDKHRYITIKDGETEVGTIDLGTRELTAKVYNVKRNYGRAAFGKFVDISTLTADFEAQDGDVLSGTLAKNVKISIAAGAMVTLNGASINDNDAGTGRHWTDGNYAGLTCLGSATIILADGTTNTVRNFGVVYPGIQAGPSGTTLTICGGSLGTGELITRGHYNGAGIGSVVGGTCGHITIEGGTVTANGEGEGSGIGSAGSGTCGDITINGGTVTATGDSSYQGGAGIGSGYVGSCGKINISGGSVNATGGKYSAGIGSGGSANNIKTSCGIIEITGGIVTATGGENGAGIGSGRSNGSKQSTCDNITITLTSGSITATGGTNGAGIGTGNYGICGTISISLTGGSVTATGGTNGAGIGTGTNGTCGSINVVRHPAASTQYVTVTADRNEGKIGDNYDIGKGANGTINGTVSIGSNVKTSGGEILNRQLVRRL